MQTGAFRVKRYKSGHSVFDEHGERKSGILTHSVAKDHAEALHRMSKWKMRKCLRCGDDFNSEGAHNRMCHPCRQRDSGGLDDCCLVASL
jgi:tRNA(Ile2) C34 agmatinyltransferase TiaS